MPESKTFANESLLAVCTSVVSATAQVLGDETLIPMSKRAGR